MIKYIGIKIKNKLLTIKKNENVVKERPIQYL